MSATERKRAARRYGRAAVTAGVVLACVQPGAAQAGYDVNWNIASATEYHSNAYLADGLLNEVHPALSLHLRPELQFVRDTTMNSVSVRGEWNVRKFIDVEPDDAFVTANLDRFRDMALDLTADLRREARVGVRVDDHFEVLSSPAQLETAAADTNANVRLTSNDARAAVVVRPGSALEVGLGGNVGLDRYDVPAVLASDGNPNLNNRTTFGPVLDARWRFLPRTSVVGKIALNWLEWENNLVNAVGPDVAAAGNPYGTYIGKPDATKWHASTGLRGQVTERLAVVAELGFGQMDYDDASVRASAGAAQSGEVGAGGEAFTRDLATFGEGFTTNLLVRYGLDGDGRHVVDFGYKKDFQDAFFTNYVVYNNVSASYRGNLGTRTRVETEGTLRFDDYYGEVTRSDIILRVRAGAHWRPRAESPLEFGLSAGWNERACADAACENGGFYGVQYDDFYSRLAITYTHL